MDKCVNLAESELMQKCIKGKQPHFHVTMVSVLHTLQNVLKFRTANNQQLTSTKINIFKSLIHFSRCFILLRVTVDPASLFYFINGLQSYTLIVIQECLTLFAL